MDGIHIFTYNKLRDGKFVNLKNINYAINLLYFLRSTEWLYL